MNAFVCVSASAASKNWSCFYIVGNSQWWNASRNLVRPYVLLILINHLKTYLLTFKFIDGVTITEITSQAGSSQMQAAADNVAEWSCFNLRPKKEFACFRLHSEKSEDGGRNFFSHLFLTAVKHG
jgi:hypothetical protein